MTIADAANAIIRDHKDFDLDISELLVFRMNICDLPKLSLCLEPYVSGNEINSPRIAIDLIARLLA